MITYEEICELLAGIVLLSYVVWMISTGNGTPF